MATKFELNDAMPAAPAGRVNIQWQFDANGNVSAHAGSVPSYQTPWLQHIDAANYDLNNLGVLRLSQVTLGELDPGSGLVGFANEAGTLHAKTGNGGSIDLESIGNGRVQVSTDGTRRIVVHQNGNVGIGPSMNPAYTLDVQGTCNVSGAFTAPLSVQSALFKSSADMVFQVGSGFPERVRISAANANALVTITGINQTGTDSITGLFLERSYGDAGDSMNIVWSGTGASRLGRVAVILTAGGESSMTFHAMTGSGDGSNNEVMRIRGNRMVGIGTTDPVSTLSITGPQTAAGGINIATTGEPGNLYGFSMWRRSDGWMELLAHQAGVGFSFKTATTERFTIADSGVVQMWLGGSLKTLSVDGSGFVKAT